MSDTCGVRAISPSDRGLSPSQPNVLCSLSFLTTQHQPHRSPSTRIAYPFDCVNGKSSQIFAPDASFHTTQLVLKNSRFACYTWTREDVQGGEHGAGRAFVGPVF